KLEERLEIFLNRQSTDGQKYWPPQIEVEICSGAEQVGIHAARPQLYILEAASFQFCGKRRCRRKHGSARRVETPQPGPRHFAGPVLRDRQALGNVIRKSRVKAGCKWHAPPQADAARGVTERPLGRNMNCIRLSAVKSPFDAASYRQCQPDFRIARHRQCPELIGADKFHLNSLLVRLARDVTQGAYNSIDLRMPGISDNQNLHALRPL